MPATTEASPHKSTGRRHCARLAHCRDDPPGSPARRLSEHPPGFDKISFIGSTATGRDVTLDHPGRSRGPYPIRRWLIWPVTAAVAQKAADENTDAAFDDAMALLALLTPRLTAEFAVRTLLRHDLEHAVAVMLGWAASPDADVRRLASEGARPYLPWAVRVPGMTARPGVTVPILDSLYRDDSAYVRRSVANRLNDLSRDDPALVVQVAGRWLAAPDVNTHQVVRHALRTLVKRGDPGALALLGFTSATVETDGPVLERLVVPFGGELRFTASVRNPGTEPVRLAIDYAVHHRRANGGQSAKTFELTTCTPAAGEAVTIDRRHSFRPISTRRYHPGGHAVALQVNGVTTSPVSFELAEPDQTGAATAAR